MLMVRPVMTYDLLCSRASALALTFLACMFQSGVYCYESRYYMLLLAYMYHSMMLKYCTRVERAVVVGLGLYSLVDLQQSLERRSCMIYLLAYLGHTMYSLFYSILLATYVFKEIPNTGTGVTCFLKRWCSPLPPPIHTARSGQVGQLPYTISFINAA